MTKKYIVGKIKLLIDMDFDKNFDNLMADYENDYITDPHITVTVIRTSDEISLEYTDIVRIGKDKYYVCDNESDIIINYDSVKCRAFALTKYSKDYSHIDIIAYDVTRDYSISDENYIFNLVGNSMHYAAYMYSGVIFHSSAIACNDGGVVFSAKSGTGKSTHTSLWRSQFTDVEYINDDTPLIRADSNGDVWLCGTPWAGSSGINTNKIVPLRAIVFLERAPENSIRRISPSESLQLFYNGVNSPVNTKMYISSLDTLNKILSNVPTYILSCNMEAQAAHIARSYIFNNNTKGE